MVLCSIHVPGGIFWRFYLDGGVSPPLYVKIRMVKGMGFTIEILWFHIEATYGQGYTLPWDIQFVE